VLLEAVDVTWPAHWDPEWQRRREFLLPYLLWSRDTGNLHLPPWLVLSAFGALTAFLWWYDRCRVRPGQCRRCGYDLTGNVSGRCPECGAAMRAMAHPAGSECPPR